MFSLGNDNVGTRDVEQKRQRARSLLDKARGFFRVLHINSVHLQEHVAQLDTGRSSRRPFHNKGYDGTFVQSINNGSIRIQKERIGQFLGLEEHNSQRGSENARIVKFSTWRKVAIFFLFGNRSSSGGRSIKSHITPQISICLLLRWGLGGN